MDPQKFARIAESLRQYRRAELKDFEEEVEGKPLDVLYVDPLPDNAILNSVLSSNTTFLLGRKGTGKSTIFARAQAILRERKDSISTYIDVKSLYDVMDAGDIHHLQGSTEVDEGVSRAHMLRKEFLGRVMADLLKEVDNVCQDMSVWDRWSGKKKSYDDLRTKLTTLQTRIREAVLEKHELPILQRITRNWKTRQQHEASQDVNAGATANMSMTGPTVNAHATVEDFDKSLDDKELYDEYSDVVLRTFPFAEIIREVQVLLAESGLKRLIVFFDDFSELKFVDQRLFVDVVLAPLNNSSNEAIKLKIAGYPGRVYYGRIDATKIDTISLDFSDLYESGDVQTMEQSAIDYAARLLKTRFSAFGEDISDYFDSSVPLEEHMRLCFQTTFNVPRLMGSLLHTCYLDRISRAQPITQASVRLAARKYYETTILRYFDRLNRFALEPFENKLDRHNQSELLKHIIQEARSVRRRIAEGSIGGSYFQDLGGNPPTSHFIVSPSLAAVLQPLEANFLLSRYKDTRDKNGEPVVVYALYYGLTESERLAWGYPPGREYRNYFVQRSFEFTGAIHEFLSQNQTIRCNRCVKSFPLELKASLELYRWRCPECGDGLCSIVNLAEDFEAEVRQLRKDLMLEPVELEILNTLNQEDKAMRAGEISVLIDDTYQLVGKRTSKLQEMGLVDKLRGGDKNVRSRVTERAQATYFQSEDSAELGASLQTQ